MVNEKDSDNSDEFGKQETPSHFEGKSALDHVVTKQAEGLLASEEFHSEEAPGHLFAACDTAKETAVALLFLWTVLAIAAVPFGTTLFILAVFSVGWALWKAGRSARLGWSRLERLHRIAEEERWEIQHHRDQEKSELTELYRAKGFEGKLLEDVIDTLMADEDRLLTVMLEEELGLQLGQQQHPLIQGFGSLIGSLVAIALAFLFVWLLPVYGMGVAAFIIVGVSSAIAARRENNQTVHAIVWNIGIAGLSFGILYFLIKIFNQ
ncbi:VIT1/CCC1 transporter family protein [Simkania negevensis]|uniref:VIT1/CCC1 transporter family protein n=1 Tax=Simkania negevensis TaxID=83561 RepID=A0ABS3APL0_9BACT|nr:VIT1/CCC1 transporter family protein [Simkania negevensis]